MKVSLPGMGGIKNLALAHGEKAVIAIVAALVVYMVLRSLGRETLSDDRQADDLQQQIQRASSELQQFDWDRAAKDFPDKVRFAKPLEQKGETYVDPAKYLADTSQFGRNPPIVPPTVRRSDPVLLSVVDVEATGGSGLLAFTNDEIRRQRQLAAQRKQAAQAAQQQQQREKEREESARGNRRGNEAENRGRDFDPAHPNRRRATGIARSLGVEQRGDEEIKVAYWAVVVGKVPIKEQIKLYEDAFSRSLGYTPQADFPQYIGFFVQRAEAKPNGAAIEEKDWRDVTVYNGKGEAFGPVVSFRTLYGQEQDRAATARTAPTAKGVTSDWAGRSLEVVDPRYTDPNLILTFPLPPLVGRNWGREVTHSDIPFAEDAVQLETETAPVAEDAAKPAEEVDMFGGGPGRGGQPGMMGGRGMGGPGGAGGRGMSMMDGDYGGEYGGRGMMEGGMGGGGRGFGSGVGADGMPVVKDWLLRFFDFSVQPGKKYKYRVQLALLDPNQSYGNRMVSTDWLDKEALERVRKDKAARGNKMPHRRAAWSKPSRTASIPLAGNVHVASAKPPVETSFIGEPQVSLLVESFSADEKGRAIQGSKKFDNFLRGSVANRKAEADAIVAGDEGEQMLDKIKDFQFQTGITVADIRGGERLPGRDNLRPARVLLMDPAGQLFVRTELADADTVKLNKAIFEEDADGRRGGGDPFGGMRDEMMGPRGGPGAFGGR